MESRHYGCFGMPKKYTEAEVLPEGEVFLSRCLACKAITLSKATRCPCGGLNVTYQVSTVVRAARLMIEASKVQEEMK